VKIAVVSGEQSAEYVRPNPTERYVVTDSQATLIVTVVRSRSDFETQRLFHVQQSTLEIGLSYTPSNVRV